MSEVPEYIARLWRALTDPVARNYMYVNDNGNLVMHDKKAYTKVLALHFSSIKYTSILRTLRKYGIVKIGHSKGWTTFKLPRPMRLDSLSSYKDVAKDIKIKAQIKRDKVIENKARSQMNKVKVIEDKLKEQEADEKDNIINSLTLQVKGLTHHIQLQDNHIRLLYEKLNMKLVTKKTMDPIDALALPHLIRRQSPEAIVPFMRKEEEDDYISNLLV